MITIKDRLKSITLLLGITAAVMLLLTAAGATMASAEVQCDSCTPWWQLSFQTLPANLPPGGEGEIGVFAEDLGDSKPNASTPIVLTDKLPGGLTAQSVELRTSESGNELAAFYGEFFCKALPHEVVCNLPGGSAESFIPTPYSWLEIEIRVKVATTAESGEENHASIVGAGAPGSLVFSPITVSGAPTRFGIEHYALRAENADGSSDTQAGSHPFQLTTSLFLNGGSEAVVNDHRP